MTIHIPDWLLWTGGGVAAVAVVGLAIVGAVYIRAFRHGPFG